VTTAAQEFLALHHGAGFILPNAWDAGTARVFESLGFPAVATTSAGIAWSLGMPDGGPLSRDENLERVAEIAGMVSVPVTADLEDGYGSRASDVAETVRLAVVAGAVGGNIEDARDGVQYEVAEAVDRLAAAREAGAREAFVLNARIDGFFLPHDDDPFAATIARANAYVEAGADCIFIPAVHDERVIARLVAEVPAPLNLVAGLGNAISPRTLASLGVARVSVGGGIARAALSFVERAGRELLETGTLGFLDGAASYAQTQARFGE
jgi:2-methylisocitrate lyase-like PEP mutase family enzyme